MHLKAPGSTPKFPLKKSKSQHGKTENIEKAKSNSVILDSSCNSFAEQNVDDRFFQMSFQNMTNTKPLPANRKKSCYNYKCKFMKKFVFDEKGKT